MNLKNLSLVMAIAVMSVSSVSAQGDFFFSFEQGGANADQAMDFNVGDTGSLWIYWTTNGPSDSDLDVGAFLDITSTTSGVLEFTAAETFDYDILVGDTPIGTRLAGEGVGSVPVAADFIDELAAFTVTGDGILEANDGSGAFLDEGYTASNDGFEWGRIDFNVIGEGTTTVSGVGGDGLIVNGVDEIDAVFTTATINVGPGNSIPEPSTAGLLALGLTGLVARRRR